MIFNPFWITLTELLVVPGTSSTSPVSAPDIYIYIYILRERERERERETERKTYFLCIYEDVQKVLGSTESRMTIFLKIHYCERVKKPEKLYQEGWTIGYQEYWTYVSWLLMNLLWVQAETLQFYFVSLLLFNLISVFTELTLVWYKVIFIG